MFRFCYLIALGSNLGDLERNLEMGTEALRGFGSFCFFSKRHVVPAVLPPNEPERVAPDYLNQVSLFLSKMAAEDLYHKIKTIEDHFGHPRNIGQMWPDRHLDIDLLLMWERTGELNIDRIESRAIIDQVVLTREIVNECGWQLREHQGSSVTIPHREFSQRGFLQKMFCEARRV